MNTKEISGGIAHNFTVARKNFGAIYDEYLKQKTLVSNMIKTRKKLTEELDNLSDNWLKSLVDASGIQTEENGKLSVMMGINKENIARITPAIDDEKLKLFDICCKANEAAAQYKHEHAQLSKAILEPLRTSLTEEIKEKVKLLHGINLLMSREGHETDNDLSDIVRDIKTLPVRKIALEHIHNISAEGDNLLSLYPGLIPEEVNGVGVHLPSPGLIAVAKRNPQKMKELAEALSQAKGCEG
ncbi:hypothetical protein IQ454_002336 [Salmonella enterica]|nr:hypothetical protein [Salmonella enterica]EGL4358714.1 hypothetical protein [Salmonella enterica]EGL4381867.1 hypothetical protein [Salmonella enterica]EGL4485846.1 hypothetical protein [Salmonella enterica]EGL4514518.1 hypothetical protein [Salmonella enterica]